MATECLQLATNAFDFDLIRETRQCKKYQSFAETEDLIRDICSTEITDDTENDDALQDFLYVIQKSPKWLRLRARAQATASSIGKYIKSPGTFPTRRQLTEVWREKLHETPFTKTHTMCGHMKWGVVYEDIALMHFAVENMKCVVQVGTIHVPLDYVLSLNTDTEIELPCYPKEYHLLISPDGVVQTPKAPPGCAEGSSSSLLGMLEIKCISPFHHKENDAGDLTWVDTMEKRQWYKADEIPFGYIIQICLQAISGYYRLKMNGDHIMWFIRWSPKGFSEFQIAFKDLIGLGVLSSLLYFSLYSRLNLDLENLDVEYTSNELYLHKKMVKEYKKVTTLMRHRYISHQDLYPEFDIYHKCTKRYTFKVED